MIVFRLRICAGGGTRLVAAGRTRSRGCPYTLSSRLARIFLIYAVNRGIPALHVPFVDNAMSPVTSMQSNLTPCGNHVVKNSP